MRCPSSVRQREAAVVVEERGRDGCQVVVIVKAAAEVVVVLK